MRLPNSEHARGLSRRDFVRVGALTGLGTPWIGWAGASAAESSATVVVPRDARQTRARACILIWLDGGPSHLEMFDPKPNAPAEVRGPFGIIDTAVPGVQISELLPRTAQRLNQIAVIRSVTSPLGEHNLGTHYLLTGYKPSPVLDFPTLGSVVTHELPARGILPPFVAVPNHRVGGGRARSEGFLPAATGPFEVGPAQGNEFRVPNLDFYPGLNVQRLENRRRFVQALDQFSRQVDSGSPPADPVLEQAYRLITSDDAKRAFNLKDEPPAVRQRYGSRAIGLGCLLARRLVERGVSFVTVNNPGWDTHQQLVTQLRDGFTGAKDPVGLVPSLDLAFSALVDDLSERGLLDETLILVMGEFGRTPKINTSGGRDHWPRVFTVVAAGAGIRGGQVIGASDSTGESPRERPVTPADVACTVYTLLGIDPAKLLYTPDGRPIHVNQHGKAIRELV